MLIGIVCIAIGFFSRDSTLGRTVLGLGFALAALGGLDTSAREHWAGFRSHTLVLAAFPAVVAAILSALAGVPHRRRADPAARGLPGRLRRRCAGLGARRRYPSAAWRMTNACGCVGCTM